MRQIDSLRAVLISNLPIAPNDVCVRKAWLTAICYDDDDVYKCTK
jgi:hypothetical protein